MSGQLYTVESTLDEGGGRGVSSAGGHNVSTSVVAGSTEGGMNAAQVLLTAFTTCLMTNMVSISRKMDLQLGGIRLVVTGRREEDPPRLTELKCVVHIKADAPKHKLERLIDLSLKYGTVTNTLMNGLTPSVEVVSEQ